MRLLTLFERRHSDQTLRPLSLIRGGVSLPWPLPAVLAWALAWLLYLTMRAWQWPTAAALAVAAFAPLLGARAAHTAWRRGVMLIGFPLSVAVLSFSSAWPAWTWLLPIAPLLAAYPLRAWRDAPVFPTPAGALRGLAALAPLGPGARVADAGCGLGDGLRELRREYPNADLTGWEWSWLLRAVCAWRAPFARVARADLWQADWSGFDLVYVFQRPESMPRAAQKAANELRPGAWLASLEFAVPGLAPTCTLACRDGRSLHLYRAPVRIGRDGDVAQ